VVPHDKGTGTVGFLRGLVADLEGVAHPQDVVLSCGGRPLTEDEAPLTLLDGVNVFSTLRLRGGGKKRKKKTYTKPKKIKHKKKKVVMPSLKFYKVGDDGKVTRLRKECPTCGSGGSGGSGVFMAKHTDRHYCGRCALTYVAE